MVDSGGTVNVLPYALGLRLGAVWDDRKASNRLTGSLGSRTAMPVFVVAKIEGLPAVRLAFAWTNQGDVPLILGQTYCFLEFDLFPGVRRLLLSFKACI